MIINTGGMSSKPQRCMNPELLAKAGRLLYGEQWQCALARALEVHRITVQRWVSGRTPIPAYAQIAIAGLLMARQRAIADLLSKIPD